MLKCFEAEEASGNPYRSEVLTELGLSEWPNIMRQAITAPDGSEITLAAALSPRATGGLPMPTGIV
jgi:hypothetical protein